MISRETKLQLVGDIAHAARQEEGLSEGYVTSAVVIVELAIPGSEAPKALYVMTSDAQGMDLRSWDSVGLLASSLRRILDAGAT